MEVSTPFRFWTVRGHRFAEKSTCSFSDNGALPEILVQASGSCRSYVEVDIPAGYLCRQNDVFGLVSASLIATDFLSSATSRRSFALGVRHLWSILLAKCPIRLM
jgi:hypothetical protein